MNSKKQILDLYYNQHLKQNEIAKLVGKSCPYVSKVVKTDNRNKQEKENRKKANAENRKNYLREYYKTYVRPKKDDNSYEQMLANQKQDAMELSYNNDNISDYAFAKWNSSIYHTDNNGNLRINKKMTVSKDVPKIINKNVKVPIQKHKR